MLHLDLKTGRDHRGAEIYNPPNAGLCDWEKCPTLWYKKICRLFRVALFAQSRIRDNQSWLCCRICRLFPCAKMCRTLATLNQELLFHWARGCIAVPACIAILSFH